MGKLAKLFLILLLLIAIALPRVAMKISDMIEDQRERIGQLESDVEDIRGKLRDSEEERETLRAEVDSEKKKRIEVERTLASVRQQLDTVKTELKKKEADLNSCVIERKKVQEEVKKLQDEKSDLKSKLAKQAEELGRLKRIGGSREAVVVPDAKKKAKSPGQDGRIGSITGSRFLTINLDIHAGLAGSPTFFVHRRGKVVGKATVRRIHGATVVVETSDEEVLKNLKSGDMVKVEGGGVLISESFEGRVAEVSPHGFVGIDVDRRPGAAEQPVFGVSRDGNLIGKIRVEKIVSLFMIVELKTKGRMKISQGDYLRMPR